MISKTQDQVTKMNTRERKEREVCEEGEEVCQVCMNKIKIWSVGECNHAICYVCSTRMRVLCQRNECAICRQDLPKVIFTLGLAKFEDIKDNIYPMDRKFKICFETEEIQNSYSGLLDHQCPVCEVSVKYFPHLSLIIIIRCFRTKLCSRPSDNWINTSGENTRNIIVTSVSQT